MFFIKPCSSSSLLLDGLLPFESERTAGGATVTKRRGGKHFGFCHVTGTTANADYCTLSCVVSDVSELPALIQEKSELFNAPVLQRTEQGEDDGQEEKTAKVFLYHWDVKTVCFSWLITKRLSFTIWPVHQQSG